MNRIICIGNRYVESDALGARVFDILSRRELPADVELFDGGLAGLNLLPLMDDCERVVFVDAIAGDDDGVQILDADEVAGASVYGHAGGLGYLLGAHRALGGRTGVGLWVVGTGATESALAVAEAALSIALGEEICQ